MTASLASPAPALPSPEAAAGSRPAAATDCRGAGLLPSRAAYLLAGGLAVVSAAAGAATAFAPAVLTGPAVMNGSARGTALVVLVLAVPTLALAAWRTAAGSPRALPLFLGSVGYLLYNAVMLLFATPFNRLFLVYVAMLSLALWTTLVTLASVDSAAFARAVHPGLPRRAIAGYIWVVVVLNALAWLASIVPALLADRPAAVLDGTGIPTSPTWIQDLAFWLPLMAVAAWWLWHGQPWGYLVAAAVLVMWVIEAVGVAVDQWLGHAADPASPVASASMTVVFGVLAAVGLVPVVAFVRALPAATRRRQE